MTILKEKILVTQDNALIESCYSMSLTEKRLLLLCISKLDPRKMPAQEMPLSFKVSAAEFAKTYELDYSNALRDLERAAKDLRTCSVTLRLDDRDRIMNWVDSIDFLKNENSIIFSFGFKISHYLLGMAEQFTTINFFSVRKLKRVHSIRLYELLLQFKQTGFRIESVENLRFSLGCVDEYPAWGDFNRYVISRAVEELNERSDIRIKYDVIKNGRAVTAVKFTFKKEEQLNLFDEQL